MRVMQRAFAVGQRAVDMGLLEKALEDHSETLAEYALVMAEASVEAEISALLPTEVMATMREAGNVAADLMSGRRVRSAMRGARSSVSIEFDYTNPEAVEWARVHSAELVAGVNAETRAAIREIIFREFAENQTPQIAARAIRAKVGLLKDHVDAVHALRRKMLSARPGTKVWAGNTPIRLPEGPVPMELVNLRCEQYSARLLSYRAEMIARTESLAASNEGQRQLWLQATREGLLRGNEAREWIVTPDERLCPDCDALNGEVAPLNGMFEVGVMGPPLHPQCRCTVVLSDRRTFPVSPAPQLSPVQEMLS